MDNELFKVLLAVSVVVMVVLLELIRYQVRSAAKELKQLTAIMEQVRNSLHGVETIIRSQEQTIAAARERDETKIETELLNDKNHR
jgi:hypothetical protein